MKIYDLDSSGVGKIVSDLATPNPTLSVTNTSTGFGLLVDGLAVVSNASVANNLYVGGTQTITGAQTVNLLAVASAASVNNSFNVTGTSILKSGVTEAIPLTISHSVMGSATVAPVRITASTASQPFFSFFGGGYAAVVTGNATPSFGVRVKFGDTYAWMLAYPAVA